MTIKKRLNKYLAESGIASRRACEKIIFNGRVKINQHVEISPQRLVDLENDYVTVDGKKVTPVEHKYYYLLNKPLGYVCTNSSRQKRTVLSLFPDELRLFTIGRLDKNTSGLIIVTNDGAFAQKVIHPSSNITKEYLIKCHQEITHPHLVALSQGIEIEGTYVIPQSVKKVRKGTLKISVNEGKKHEIRLLCASVGLDILELKRIRLGSLHLGHLPSGAYRPLTPGEIASFSSPHKS